MKPEDLKAQKIAKLMLSREGSGPSWGVKYEDGGVGWAKVSFVIKDNMLNGNSTIHGGMIFALADTAFAYACNSRNDKSVAQQASIAFLSPANAGERITATAREEALQGRSGSYSVNVTGEDGRVIATFQGLSRTIRVNIIDEEDV